MAILNHHRLHNWARHVRLGRYRFTHCKSIEHRTEPWHNPPQAAQIEWLYAHGHIDELGRIQMYEALPKPPPMPVDAADADLIERGWRVMPGQRHKDALKLVYIRRWPKHAVGKVLKEPEIDHFMLMAVASLSISVEQQQQQL